MSNELSPEEQQKLVGMVAESLAQGQKADEISAQLVNGGWEQEAADEFVASVALHLASAQHDASESSRGGGGEGMGWLLWIGALLFINLLSWLFDWPFWVY